ncbi:Ubiquitin-conjugating enzyme E2 22 [Dichanthelium oligosanthes]|uniref:E2 ubiquitin-conjugating enzyme n=1 Tax=Dichanthelium oligosanthes TaxID=888268 RepID=A0A1E5VB96_9POAL|nr:Ubiquitin-conjugating enzyme E2 22 [Dichanthelium oligosanthes]
MGRQGFVWRRLMHMASRACVDVMREGTIGTFGCYCGTVNFLSEVANNGGSELSAIVASMVSIENSKNFRIFCDVKETSLQLSCAVSHDSNVMSILKATNENLPPNVIRQLAKELKNLDESPPEGINVIVNDDDFTTIFADIEGPAGTPYENGVFRMKLLLSHDFPQSPPKGFFLTKIFHPNIATSGEICVNTLKKDWNPGLGLRHVLLVVRCLLIEPFPESALNEQAGKMLLENYEEYARHARLYTGIHALKPKNKSKTGAISESTTALNVDKSSTASSENTPSMPPACAIFHDSNGICICASLKATNENLPPNVIRQLAKELKNLDDSPPEGIKVSVNDDDFTTIFADIEGPAGTPYENGVFRMKLLLSRDFPQSPPKGFFLTKIFHPNIATSGEICVNTLKKDWNPGLGLRHVLLVVRCLLIEPFPESALNEQAGKLLLENYEEYARHARLYTSIHALKLKNKSKSGAISESTTALNVGQSNTVLGENTPLASAVISTSVAAKALGKNSQDQSAAASEPVVGASTAPKKDAPHGAKGPVDKKKLDARKKSLKRL